jgi:hypothetical protein
VIGAACSTLWRDKTCVRIIFVAKPEEKRKLERHRHRWEYIRMDLREMGWESVDWIHLAQVRDQWRAVLKTVLNPLISINERGNLLTS